VVPAAWIERQAGIQSEVEATTCTGEFEGTDCLPQYDSRGEALFNLGRVSGFASGAFSCARCHTARWSYAYPGSSGFADAGVEPPPSVAAPGPAGGGGFAANLWDVDRKFGEATGPNGGPMEVAVDAMGHPRTLTDGTLITVIFDVAVVMDPAGPYLARDESSELVPVVDGEAVDLEGEPITEIEGHPVEVVPEVALDSEGGALLEGDGLARVGRTEPFSSSQIEFIQAGGQEGVAYGDLVVSNGGWQMPGFGEIYTPADIASIVAYERTLDGDNARTDYVTPTLEAP
jgi:hypothetical protein